MERELKVVGSNASIAPSTLEKGIEPVHPRRKRRSRKSEVAPEVNYLRVAPFLWAAASTLAAARGLYLYIEAEDSVLILNHPAHEISWVERSR